MIVNILMPTLFPQLAMRALRSIMNHGCAALSGVEVRPMVVCPAGVWNESDLNVTVYEQEPQGVNAALRFGVVQCDGDLVHVTADDVIYQPGWLRRVLDGLERVEQRITNPRLILGVRHIGGIGTCWGRMYANFPLFRRSLLDDPYMREHFMPAWLRGQWGDVAFGLACWHAGGVVVDDGGPIKLSWADRMGLGEAPTKGVADGADMKAIVQRFAPVFGAGWGTAFRDFNLDCDPSMLVDGTICIPDQRHFDAARKRSRMSFGAGIR